MDKSASSLCDAYLRQWDTYEELKGPAIDSVRYILVPRL